MSNFHELMKSKSKGVFPGRTKRDIAEIVDRKVHMDGVAEGIGVRGRYVAFTVSEYPENFFYAGGVIADALADCAVACGGFGQVNEDLKEAPMEITVRNRKSAGGNMYRYLDI